MSSPKQSAGLLAYRIKNNLPEFLLVHPGGPFWKNKDAGVWSVPKGEFTDDEDALTAAKREFAEELGQQIDGDFKPLKAVKLKSGKTVHAWSVEADVDVTNIRSNTCEIEWPPRSGKKITIPEVDRAGWFSADEARTKINAAQVSFINEVIAKI